MQELITKWEEFSDEWNNNPANIKTIYTGNGEEKVVFKPEFYDFMEWLTTNK